MLLLIPGPVATRPEVKSAFSRDYAPWDPDFRAQHAQLRARLLDLAGGSASSHAVLPLQGCGHFAIEAALRTFVPPGGRVLIPDTGDYADHMTRLAREAGREVVSFPVDPRSRLEPSAVADALDRDPTISHVGLVHSETGTGVCHDVVETSRLVAARGRRTIIDAISSFGALPLNVNAMPEVDAVVFTANKCLEGMPGLAFVVVNLERVRAAKGNAGSWSLDLADVYEHSLQKPAGTWRFTPSAQAVAALLQALDLYEEEGGRPARLARYEANTRRLYDGITGIGLRPCLSRQVQGPVVLNVHAPRDERWDLQTFVRLLKSHGVIISNFYNTEWPSFRIGCIGNVHPGDMDKAVAAIDAVLGEMEIRVSAPSRGELIAGVHPREAGLEHAQ